MKECKVLEFSVRDAKGVYTTGQRLPNQYSLRDVWGFPKIEKFLNDYLNQGFEVKNMMEMPHGYLFYLERDVPKEGENV